MVSRSQVYQDYEQAFSQASGLPLRLRTANGEQLLQQATKYENPLCALVSKTGLSCAACCQEQTRVAMSSERMSKTVICCCGNCDTSVPVMEGGKLLCFLQTGQVFLKQPTKRQFARLTRQLLERGLKVDLKGLERLFFETRVLSRKQYNPIINLLTIFAQHLSFARYQILVMPRHEEPASVTSGRKFIEDHLASQLTLTDVARAAKTSTY